MSGKIDTNQHNPQVTTFHVVTESSNDILHKFWELEEQPKEIPLLSHEEREVVRHFESNHYRGKFVVPLPRNNTCKPIGESSTQAVRRFISLEKALHSNGRFKAFETVMSEYMDLGHAEPVPFEDLEKPPHHVFYLPMHAVYKQSSTQIRALVLFTETRYIG